MARTAGRRPSPNGRRRAFGEGFAVFAECLLAGVWLSAAALPVVTLPAAFAAAARHLDAHTAGEAASFARFRSDLRTAVRESWRAGLAVLGAAVLLTLNLVVLAQEGVPGRSALAAATFAVAGLGLTLVLRAAADWTPGRRWRDLFADALAQTRDDPSGTGILFGGVAVTAVSAWALWLLAVPMAGCLAGAAVAVKRRRLAREAP